MTRTSGAQAPAGARALAWLMLVGLGLGAVAALAGSFVPYNLAKARIESFRPPDARGLTPARHAAIVTRLRGCGAVLGAGALALAAWRRRVARGLGRRATATRATLRRLAGGGWRAWGAESPGHRLALGAVCLLAAGLRLAYLFEPMRMDEARTVMRYASRPLLVGLSAYTSPNNHVFHTFWVHLSIALFGDAEWAVRLPALVAGVLMVPAAYVAGRRLYGRHAGLLAAGLVAASSALVDFSTNARGYTMQALAVLLLIAVVDDLRRRPTPGGRVLFAVLAALGFYTIPTMLYPFAGIVLWWLASGWVGATRRRRRALVRGVAGGVAGALVLTAALYLPVIAVSGPTALVGNPDVRPLAWDAFLQGLPRSVGWAWEQWNQDLPAVVSWALVAGFAVTLVVGPPVRGRREAWLLPMSLVLGCALAVLVQRVAPFRRVWLFALPVYLMAAAAGVTWVAGAIARRVDKGSGTVAGTARRVLRTTVPDPFASLLPAAASVMIAVWVGGNVLRSDKVRTESIDTGLLREAGAVVQWLDERRLLRPDDGIVNGPYQQIEYYLHRRGLPLRYYNAHLASRPRLLAVLVDDYRRPTVPQQLRQAGVDPEDYHPPKLLSRIGPATVYELLPRDATLASQRE